VRRVIGADGRSRAYVNGQVVPIQALREFAEFLIEIHGQQEFQHLVKRSAQRELLDEHSPMPALHRGWRDIYERYRACRRDFEALKSAALNREARLDLLRYQLAELKAEVPRWPRSKSCSWSRSASRPRPVGGGGTHRAHRRLRGRRGQRARFIGQGASGAARRPTATRNSPRPAELLSEAMIITRGGGGLRRYLDAL
jgi:hypothetical protein